MAVGLKLDRVRHGNGKAGMRIAALALMIVSLGLTCLAQGRASQVVESTPVAESKPLPNGVWGGEHIRMEVSDNGAEIEFDCASGSISQRIQLDAKGRFRVAGTYRVQSPAPAAAYGEGGAPGAAATYTGTLTDNGLHLEVLLDGQATPMVFDLVIGDEGHLAKCA